MILWSTPNRTRYFLIPYGVELPPGDLLLRTPTGGHLEVDSATVASFELPPEEAKAWTREELAAVLSEARGRIFGYLDRLRDKLQKDDEDPS